jgi:acetoin:2,6-dichlorophenolindophenol oxidoreductase subunit alpha
MDNRNVNVGRLRMHFRTMLRIRAFEEAAEEGSKSGEITGAVHLSIGQEAVASGVCLNLAKHDYVVSNHRGHGHAIAKGAELTPMLAELFGRRDGLCGGKGGSMHVADFSIGLIGSNGVVAAGIPIAVGAAQSSRLQRNGRATVCFFGDGAVNRGPFLEGLNWARIFDLPILFVCEDNAFSATTRTKNLTGGEGAGARAEAIGLAVTRIDGNDVSAVDEAAAQCLWRIRDGQGPQFIHADTYRLKGHTAQDAALYRPAAEVVEWSRRDPIALCRDVLLTHGATGRELEEVDQEIRREMSAILAAVRAQPRPDPAFAWSDVQDVGAPA